MTLTSVKKLKTVDNLVKVSSILSTKLEDSWEELIKLLVMINGGSRNLEKKVEWTWDSLMAVYGNLTWDLLQLLSSTNCFYSNFNC